jgi:hypothetical protein
MPRNTVYRSTATSSSDRCEHLPTYSIHLSKYAAVTGTRTGPQGWVAVPRDSSGIVRPAAHIARYWLPSMMCTSFCHYYTSSCHLRHSIDNHTRQPTAAVQLDLLSIVMHSSALEPGSLTCCVVASGHWPTHAQYKMQ